MAVRDAGAKAGRSWLLLACLLYVTVAGLWIIASDALLALVVSDTDRLTRLQTYKGWLFVLVSAVVLYAVGRRAAGAAASDAGATGTRGDTPAGASLRGLQRLILLASALIVLVTLLLVGYGLMSERESVLRQARQSSENLAHVIETQTLHAMESVDFTLRSLAADVAQRLRAADARREADVHQQLWQAASALSHVRAFFVVDEHGRMIADSDGYPAKNLDFSDREYYSAHRNNPDPGLHIGAPIVSRTVSKPFIALSRRLEKPTGGFGGVIVAAVDTDYVERIYAGLDVGREGSVALFLRNGTLLVRVPPVSGEIGKSFAQRPIFSEYLERSPRGIYRTSSAIDGVERLFGYRTVPGFPLVVLVGLGEREILAGWQRTLRAGVLAMVLFALTIGILAHILIAQLGRREALASALSSGEARYRYLFDASPQPMWLRDIETRRLIEVNQAALKLYGYSREEFLGMPPEALYPPEDVERQKAFIRQRGPEADSTSAWRHVRKDGSIIDVEVTSRHFVVDGRPARLSLLTDISDRRRAEAALRESEARYRYLFESNPLPMWIYDYESLRFLAVNDAAVNLYGYSRAEFLAMTILDIRPDDEARRLQQRLQTLNQAENRSGIWRHRKRNGDIIHVDIVSHGFNYMGRRARLVLASDVSQQVQAEAALRDSEQRYRYIFEANPHPMWVYDAQTLDFIAVNDAAIENYGYSREEFLAMTIRDIRTPEDAMRLERNLPSRRDGKVRALPRRHRRKDGSSFDVEISWNTFELDGRQVRLVLAQDVTEKKRIEQALRESEERYRDLFNLSPVPMWVYDIHSLKILAVNEMAVEHYGFPYAEFVGMSIQQLYPPEDVPLLMDRIAGRVIGARNRRQLRHRLKDGTVIDVETASGPIAFGDHPARLVAIYDITLRRRAEQALHESQQRLQTITDNVPALIAYVDAAQRYRFANRMHEVWYGVPQGAFQGRTMLEALGEDRYESWRYQIEAALSGKSVTVERRNRSATREQYVRMTYLPDADGQGGVQGIYILGYDITDRKKAEEALARERTLLRQVIDNLPDHIYVKDRERRYLLINAPSLQARGLAAHDEIVGKTTFDFYVPEVAAIYDAEDQAIMETGHTLVNRERAVTQPDGQKKWHLTTKVPMRDAQGDIIGIIGINRDITEIKRAQDAIRELNALLEQRVIERTAQLEAANKELESFAYSVSHDLRAPLRSIDGFSQALLEDYRAALDQTAAGYLQRVRNASQRMAQLIDDLLELSRITRREMHRESVDLGLLAQEVIAELQKEHPERKVDVRIASGLRLQGDPNLMRIALDNLLRNAWKFTGKRDDARIEVGMLEVAEERVFFVRDNGVGFDMNYAGKLFGAFQRLHSDAEFPGTGIGLATVQRVMRRHGGRVWAESTPGSGATFYFTVDKGKDSDG